MKKVRIYKTPSGRERHFLAKGSGKYALCWASYCVKPSPATCMMSQVWHRATKCSYGELLYSLTSDVNAEVGAIIAVSLLVEYCGYIVGLLIYPLSFFKKWCIFWNAYISVWFLCSLVKIKTSNMRKSCISENLYLTLLLELYI